MLFTYIFMTISLSLNTYVPLPIIMNDEAIFLFALLNNSIDNLSNRQGATKYPVRQSESFIISITFEG